MEKGGSVKENKEQKPVGTFSDIKIEFKCCAGVWRLWRSGSPMSLKCLERARGRVDNERERAMKKGQVLSPKGL